MRLTRLQSSSTSKEQEQEYRKFYLKANIAQAKLGLMLFILPIVSFVVNDYIFFGYSFTFASFAGLRLFMLIFSILVLIKLKKTVNPDSYDLTLFVLISTLTACSGVINVYRPENFVANSILTGIAIFVIYLVIPFRFSYQSIIGFSAAIGQILIILLISKPESSSVLFTTVFSLLFANMVAAFSSWQMHGYRRNAFNEYQKRVTAQEELEKTNQNLERLVAEKTSELKKTERLAAIGSTAGMVGHDLRNPLTAISGATYYLKKNYGEQIDGKGVKMLDLIQSNVTFSDKIINDLLDYSREINLEKTKTNLDTIIQESLNLVNMPSNIQLNYNVTKTQEVKADFNKLKRVIANLIKNALDAMPNGGTVEIRTETDEKSIKIIIADTGEGISEQNQKNLFQPLFTTKAKGMGFGLAICQRIIEAHHGRISIQSVLGKGTTVTVELPT